MLYALVGGGSSTSNLIELHPHRDRMVYRLLSGAPSLPCLPCHDVDREGLVRSNHPELMRQNSTHLATPVNHAGWVDCKVTANREAK